jgi:hypothetical protein
MSSRPCTATTSAMPEVGAVPRPRSQRDAVAWTDLTSGRRTAALQLGSRMARRKFAKRRPPLAVASASARSRRLRPPCGGSPGRSPRRQRARAQRCLLAPRRGNRRQLAVANATSLASDWCRRPPVCSTGRDVLAGACSERRSDRLGASASPREASSSRASAGASASPLPGCRERTAGLSASAWRCLARCRSRATA